MSTPLPPGVTIESGNGGLDRLAIATNLAQAHIYLLGAHVSHFQPRGHEPVLFMSDASWFEVGKPIRGGVPVCFPWFGQHASDPSLPNHGTVRQVLWTLDSVTRDNQGVVTAALSLATDRFRIVHRVRVADTLRMELEVTNTGSDVFEFEEALHTYFAVSDVRQISIEGTQGLPYLSKVEGGMKQQPNEPIRITAETDRVYTNTTATCVIHDPGLRRRIVNEKTNSQTTVIWNPWVAKSKAMPDFGDDEWPGMMCIETANARENAVRLPPGQSHTMAALVRVEKM